MAPAVESSCRRESRLPAQNCTKACRETAMHISSSPSGEEELRQGGSGRLSSAESQTIIGVCGKGDVFLA